MRSCIIRKDRGGRITRVSTPSGDVSTLFDKIAGVATMNDMGMAAKAYMVIHTQRFKERFGDWTKNTPRDKKAADAVVSAVRKLSPGRARDVLPVVSRMRRPVLTRRGDVGYVTDISGAGIGDMVVVDSYGMRVLDMDALDESNYRGSALREMAWEDIKALREGEVSDDLRDRLSKALDTVGNPPLVLKGGNVGEVMIPREAVNVDGLDSYTPPSSNLTYASGEPKLFFMADDGKVYDTYAGAIIGSSGGKIKAGFLAGSVEVSENPTGNSDISFGPRHITISNDQSFIPVLSISSDSDISTKGGFVNYLIKKRMLSGERTRVGDEYRLVGYGESDGLKIYNAIEASWALKNRFGSRSTSVDPMGRVTFDMGTGDGMMDMVTKNGEVVRVSESGLRDMIRQGRFNELQSRYDGMEEMVATMVMEDPELYGDGVREVIGDRKRQESQDKSDVMNILATLGIRVMGMSEYLESYGRRNGVEPTARALADMANKVVALAEGATVEDLNEEVAHFLIDTYRGQREIDEVLELVERSPLWDQYAGRYYEVYGREYEGEELDRMVRREILGKELARLFEPAMANEVDLLVSSDNPILSLLGRIIRTIRSFFSNQRKDLNRVLERIRDLALAGDVNAFDISLLDDSDHLMYSLSDLDVAKKLLANGKSLDRLYRTLQRMRSSQAQRIGESMSLLRDIGEKVERTGGALDKNNVVLSTKSVISTTKAEVEYLITVASALRKGNGNIDHETMMVIDNVYGEIVPLIRNLRGFVNNQASDYYGTEKPGMVRDMDDILRIAETSMSDINAMRAERTDGWLEGQLRKLNINPAFWDRIKLLISNIHKDITVASRYFGTLEHSSNPILGMLGMRLTKAHQDGRTEGIAGIDRMTRMMKDRRWKMGDNEDLIQKVGGKASDYLESSRDQARYDLMYRTEQARALIEIYDLKKRLGKTEREITDMILSDNGLRIKVREEIVGYEDGKPKTKDVFRTFKAGMQNFDISDMTFEDQKRYLDIMDKWMSENRERRMKDEYYERMENVDRRVEEKIGRRMSGFTKDFLRRLSQSRSALLYDRRFMTDGRPDRSKLMRDPVAWRSYLDIDRDKRLAMSDRYADGSLKEEGSEAKMMADELRAWNEAYREEFSDMIGERKTTSAFRAALSDIQRREGNKAAFEFLLAGGRLGFSQSMWGEDQDKGYYERLVERIRESRVNIVVNMVEVENALAFMGGASSQLRTLLSMYRDSTRYGEYDFDRLRGSSSLERIKRLYDEIQGYKSTIISAANKIGVLEDMPDTVESDVTESYENALKDALDYDPTMTEIKFAKSHMSKRGQDMVDNMIRKMEDTSRRRVSWSRSETRYFRKRYGEDFRDALRQDLAAGKSFLIAAGYARTLVYPYMRRYAPRGYSNFIKGIESGRYRVTDFLDAMESKMSKEDSEARFGFDINTLDITLNNEWLEESEIETRYRNPNYRPELGYGYHMPRLDKYRNDAFFKKYGITDEGQEATLNKDRWEMRKELLDITRRSLENYDERYRSVYLIPQISKGKVERLAQAGVDPMASVSNAVRDILGERLDDPIHGQGQDLGVMDENESRYRMIPKYYLNRLENADDVSHDFAYSYSMMYLQAAMYKHKREALDDVMGYRNMMLEVAYDGGKRPESTHAYRMFQDWVNASIYDVRINNKRIEWNVGSYKIDVNKLALGWTKFVSKTNLGFSPFVAATGALTGQANFLLEGIVGQYISRDSLRYAYNEARKQMSSYVSEIGDINRTNKLYAVGEALGVFNVRNRIRSAGYNKIWRTLFRDLPFKMMEVLNSPLDPQVIIGVMDDTRLYEGRFWSYSDFKSMMSGRETGGRRMSDSEIRREWSRLRDFSIWNLVEVKDGKIVAKNAENASLIDEYMPTLSGRVRSMVQICEGNLNDENKVGASRHAIMNMLLPHRGWFLLATQRAFKKAGFNFQTGQFEEGYMRTLWRLAGDVYGALSEGRMGEIRKVLEEEYHKLDAYEQTNIKRAVINLSTFALMMAIGRALMGYREDNEDDWMAQFVTYVGFRTINEIASQTSPFLELNTIDMIQDPLVTARKLGDLVDVQNWDPFSTVQTGVYRGESKLWRQLMKFSFGKQWYNIKTARDIRQTSNYWLMTNKMTMGFFLGGTGKEDLEEDANWFFDRGR